MIAIIYLLSSPSGKQYIGFTINYASRMRSHAKPKSKKHNYHLARAISKYGWENFTKEIIYCSKDVQHCLRVMEPYFIQQYDTFNRGYNSTLGGEGVIGYSHSEERKNKIGLASTAFHKGRKKSQQHRLALSKVRTGFKFTEKIKEKMRKSHLGLKHKNKSKQQISDSLQGNTNNAKMWEIKDPNGALMQIFNLREFCRGMGWNVNSCSSRMQTKMYKGYTAKRILRENQIEPAN